MLRKAEEIRMLRINVMIHVEAASYDDIEGYLRPKTTTQLKLYVLRAPL